MFVSARYQVAVCGYRKLVLLATSKACLKLSSFMNIETKLAHLVKRPGVILHTVSLPLEKNMAKNEIDPISYYA